MIQSASNLALDGVGNIYVTGHLSGAPTQLGNTPGDIVVSNPGGDSAFLLKCATATGAVVSARTFDSNSSVTLSSLAYQSGNIYITGSFGGNIDADPISGKATRASVGDQDALLVVLLGRD